MMRVMVMIAMLIMMMARLTRSTTMTSSFKRNWSVVTIEISVEDRSQCSPFARTKKKARSQES